MYIYIEVVRHWTTSTVGKRMSFVDHSGLSSAQSVCHSLLTPNEKERESSGTPEAHLRLIHTGLLYELRILFSVKLPSYQRRLSACSPPDTVHILDFILAFPPFYCVSLYVALTVYTLLYLLCIRVSSTVLIGLLDLPFSFGWLKGHLDLSSAFI